ncbi:MAG: homoserine dehydrogenase [Deltaproteobacteria bacterium]|jgi:homoserine dehydrogenase|nr:homoserine dehydrogenase [Deltaproteobacteria bacterium]MBW2504724.1 homoserine dehydrogenase [Deltaproteobacteria bacterium]MBW2520927.1 homoserine dehydrogenase [Deltaproteobacteria bacterium]
MRTINVGLLGFGTIGTGVVKIFQQNHQLLSQRVGAELKLTQIVDLDITTDRGIAVDKGLLSTDVQSMLTSPEIDIVIELIGGYEPARSFVLQAIRNGKHIVTANKALLALHGDEILPAAEQAGVDVLYEAAVGGGIPAITAIKENLAANRITSVLGILNGTCNYILTRMAEEQASFSAVLADAQKQGYAEADPTFDIEGVDTAHKLALLCSLCFGTHIEFEQIFTEGISKITALDIEFAREFGYKLKLLAIGKHNGDMIEARVHPTMVPENYPLAKIDGVFNAIRLFGDFVGPTMLTGFGAGMDATASAVMGDVVSIARNIQAGIGSRIPPLGCPMSELAQYSVKPMEELVTPYYLRFTAKDQPGVLAQISGILGKHNISIESMIQPHRHEAEAVPIVLMTHDALERDVRNALSEIDELDIIQQESLMIRIEENLD